MTYVSEIDERGTIMGPEDSNAEWQDPANYGDMGENIPLGHIALRADEIDAHITGPEKNFPIFAEDVLPLPEYERGVQAVETEPESK
jgi:hypothetical protein